MKAVASVGVLLTLLAGTPAPAAEAALDARAGASVPQTGRRTDAARAALAAIRLPPGLRISLLAMVPGARHLALAPGGRALFVGSVQSRLHLVTLTDDAAASSVREVAFGTALKMPNGVCVSPDGTLYVAEQNRILAVPEARKLVDDAAIPATVVVAQGALIPPAEESLGHSARVCRIGPDNRLYVALGQPHNVAPRGKLALYAETGIGGIIRLNRDGTGREVFATGIRNSVGLDFNPKDGTLWFTDNQVDGMGDDIPPGELNRAAKPGLDFGFPWYGGGHTRTREYAGDPAPAGVTFPEVEMVAHAADLGLTFYSGSQFPERYRGAIFSAQHGSWNRSQPIGARVMVTTLKADGTADRTEPFAEGWNAPGGYLGRPVDVAVLPDGSLVVSDDLNGALYRISADR